VKILQNVLGGATFFDSHCIPRDTISLYLVERIQRNLASSGESVCVGTDEKVLKVKGQSHSETNFTFTAEGYSGVETRSLVSFSVQLLNCAGKQND